MIESLMYHPLVKKFIIENRRKKGLYIKNVDVASVASIHKQIKPGIAETIFASRKPFLNEPANS